MLKHTLCVERCRWLDGIVFPNSTSLNIIGIRIQESLQFLLKNHHVGGFLNISRQRIGHLWSRILDFFFAETILKIRGSSSFLLLLISHPAPDSPCLSRLDIDFGWSLWRVELCYTRWKYSSAISTCVTSKWKFCYTHIFIYNSMISIYLCASNLLKKVLNCEKPKKSQMQQDVLVVVCI